MKLAHLTHFRFLGVAGFSLLTTLAMCQALETNPLAKQEVLDQISEVLSKNAFVPGLDFSKWPDMLKLEQAKIDAAQTDEDFQRAVNAALRKFGATHMVLTAPKTAEMRSSGATVGVGIGTQRTPDGLLVTRTVADAPAERGGIVPGDVITMVDGKPAVSTQAIGGKEGSDVTLTVRHADKSTEDYILTRRRFSTLRPEELVWVDKHTAKISVYTFDYTYRQEHVEELMKDAMTASNIIIDLRDNGGGLISNFKKFLGLFVSPSLPIGTFIDRKMVDDYVAATKTPTTDLAMIAKWSPRKLRATPSDTLPVYKGHVAVLINGLSGSASEIIAAGLHDTIGAKVVGSKSAGAVLVSIYVPASNGFMLQYPLSDYVTIKGVRLEGKGVLPDVTATDVRLKVAGAPDDVVQKALQVFSEEKSADHEVG